MIDHEEGTTEDDRTLLRLADQLQAEWQMGGLSRGMYFEFAAEIATRFAAQKVLDEREACAKVCDDRMMHDMSDTDFEATDCAKVIRARTTSHNV